MRHRRHRLYVRVDHDGRIRVSSCDECVDPAEALRIMDHVREYLVPLAEADGKEGSSR